MVLLQVGRALAEAALLQAQVAQAAAAARLAEARMHYMLSGMQAALHERRLLAAELQHFVQQVSLQRLGASGKRR